MSTRKMTVVSIERRQAAPEGIPAQVLSAKRLPADIQRGMDAGASVYLTRPVSYPDPDIRRAADSPLGQVGPLTQ